MMDDISTLINLLEKDYSTFTNDDQRNTEVERDRKQVITIFKSYLPKDFKHTLKICPETNNCKLCDSAFEGPCHCNDTCSFEKKYKQIKDKLRLTFDSLDQAQLSLNDAQKRLELISKIPTYAQTKESVPAGKFNEKYELTNIANEINTFTKKQTDFKKQIAKYKLDLDILEIQYLIIYFTCPAVSQNKNLKQFLCNYITKINDLNDAFDTYAKSSGPVSVSKGLSLLGGGGVGFETLADGLAKFVVERLKQDLALYVFERIKDALSNPNPYTDPFIELKTVLPKTTLFLRTISANDYTSLIEVLKKHIQDDLDDLLPNAIALKDVPRIKPLFDKYPELNIPMEGLRLLPELAKANHPLDLIALLEGSPYIQAWGKYGDCKDSTNKNRIVLYNFLNAVKLVSLLANSLTTQQTEGRTWVSREFLQTYLKKESFAQLYIGLLMQQTRIHYNDITFFYSYKSYYRKPDTICFNNSLICKTNISPFVNSDNSSFCNLCSLPSVATLYFNNCCYYSVRAFSRTECASWTLTSKLGDLRVEDIYHYLTRLTVLGEHLNNEVAGIQRVRRRNESLAADTVYHYVASTINLLEQTFALGNEIYRQLAPNDTARQDTAIYGPYIHYAREGLEIFSLVSEKKYAPAVLKGLALGVQIGNERKLVGNNSDLGEVLKQVISTNAYVPCIMATKEILKNPHNYTKQGCDAKCQADLLGFVDFIERCEIKMIREMKKDNWVKKMLSYANNKEWSKLQVAIVGTNGNDRGAYEIVKNLKDATPLNSLFNQLLLSKPKPDASSCLLARKLSPINNLAIDSKTVKAYNNAICLLAGEALKFIKDTSSKHVVDVRCVINFLSQCKDLQPAILTLLQPPTLTENSTISKMVSLLGELGAAQNADQVKKVIETYALPPGSWQIKFQNKFTFSVGCFPGFFAGAELNTRNSPFQGKLNTTGVTVPVGLAGSFRMWGLGQYSISISALDIGALVSYRFENDANPLPNFNAANLVAPGVQFYWHIPKMPLVLGVGVQRGPILRTFDPPNDTPIWRMYFTIAYDLPLFNLVSVPRKIRKAYAY
jgi:hypothetical protein